MIEPALLTEKQQNFHRREIQIAQMAEQLLLEQGDAMTLDMLALSLDLAKGTLYKHFQSKDELFMLLLVRYEQSLLDLTLENQSLDFKYQLNCFMQFHLDQSEKTVLYHQLEEKLAGSVLGVNVHFSSLYAIRKQRLRLHIPIVEQCLIELNSIMTVRDYMAGIWALTQGTAMILNSSFYQRYLGSRDTLKASCIDQALVLPKLAHKVKRS